MGWVVLVDFFFFLLSLPLSGEGYERALSVPRKNLPLLVTTALSRARRSSGDLAAGLQ